MAAKSSGVTGTPRRVGPFVVAGADRRASWHAGSGHQRGKTIRPVIAIGVLVDLGRATEFAEHHDERRFQQASLVQIVQQRRETLIESRTQLLLGPSHPGQVGPVRVPGVEGDDVVPLDLDEARPRFDQPACQQARLAKKLRRSDSESFRIRKSCRRRRERGGK